MIDEIRNLSFIMLDKLIIYCADIGSVDKGNFGWARLFNCQSKTGDCMDILVEDIAYSLAKGYGVALGFECPLWIPVSSTPADLTKSRDVDGSRPWSAHAGSGALTTGLTQVVWVLDELRSRLGNRELATTSITLDWLKFRNGKANIFIWEAFITGTAKGIDHSEDALIACRTFNMRLPDLSVNYTPEPKVRSLIGGALLWSGWSDDLFLLRKPCLVIRPES